MKEIISKNTYCIYLDQYATSGIFENDSILWKEIKELLILGVDSGRILCPSSSEHFLETSQKEISKAKYLDSCFYELSRGYAFKAELFITSQLVISIIRKNSITCETYFFTDIKPNVLSQNEKIASFIKIKKQFDEKIEEGANLTNEIRKNARVNNLTTGVKESLQQIMKSFSVNEFIKRIEDLLNTGSIKIRGIKFTSGDIPNWIDLVIHQLLEKHKMNTNEAISLHKHLKEYGFDQIATLDIKHSLMSLIAVENKIEKSSDQIDYMRISTGLPVSDILLTDKKRKFEILFLGLDKKYNTKVLCGTESDLQQFKEELNKILD